MFTDLLNFLLQHMNMSQEDFELLLSKLGHRVFEKKTKLINAGEVENHMYFITKGLTRKFFLKGQEEVITHIVKEGGVIGSAASFFSRHPSRYLVESLEHTTVYYLSYENLETLYSRGKNWEAFGRVMTTHFLLQQERLLLDNIRLTVKERFKKFMLENPDLLQRVSQKHLASYLNIKQETFSRMKHLMYDKDYKSINA